jgi:predicted neutral ceramidase superfamily lipid hydrolase
MEVKVEISRVDLVRLSLYIMPRQKQFWIIFIIFWSVSAYGVMGSGSFGAELVSYMLLIASSTIFALIGILVSFLINQIYVLVISTKRSGNLGSHEFEIIQNGLSELTTANHTITNWSGMLSIRKSKAYIFVQINHFLYHIIPRRHFSTEEDFLSFYNELQSGMESASSNH